MFFIEEQTFLGIFIGEVFYMDDELEHCKSENFPKPVWDIYLKIKPWPFYRIMEGFIHKVNS